MRPLKPTFLPWLRTSHSGISVLRQVALLVVASTRRSRAGTAAGCAPTAPTRCRHTARTPRTRRSETELTYPVRIGRLALREDSDGPGRQRRGGGCKDYVFDRPTTYTILADRDRFGPHGVEGGHAAGTAEYVLIRDGVETLLGSKSTVELEAGDTISVRTCGGGGYGPPADATRRTCSETSARNVWPGART